MNKPLGVKNGFAAYLPFALGETVSVSLNSLENVPAKLKSYHIYENGEIFLGTDLGTFCLCEVMKLGDR